MPITTGAMRDDVDVCIPYVISQNTVTHLKQLHARLENVVWSTTCSNKKHPRWPAHAVLVHILDSVWIPGESGKAVTQIVNAHMLAYLRQVNFKVELSKLGKLGSKVYSCVWILWFLVENFWILVPPALSAEIKDWKRLPIFNLYPNSTKQHHRTPLLQKGMNTFIVFFFKLK